MAGSVLGGKKTATTNKLKYGENYYREIGKKGGTKSRGGGFTGRPDLARVAGQKGGKISRRGPAKPKPEQVFTVIRLKQPTFWQKVRSYVHI